jgi:rSAM-associated Gly-rich repeat protein
MAITTRTRLLGYLVALAALTAVPPPAPAAPEAQAGPNPVATVDARLSRIAMALRAQASDPALSGTQPKAESLLALGWVDGRGNRGWVNTRYGGAARGRYGGFANATPYYGPRRMFANGGGGFFNGAYRPGGTFVNW